MFIGGRKENSVKFKQLLIFSFSSFSILFTSNILAQENLALRREIEKIILHDTDISDSPIPGFIIGVVDHQQISISSFGSIYPDSVVLPSDTILFELGGLTKVFTAHISHILALAGQLDLNAPINTYLDDRHQNIFLKDITVKNLLTHTSGFPTHPSNLGQYQPVGKTPYETYTQTELLIYLKSIEHASPGKYVYSHLNYALLEIILEQITHKSLDELLQRYITKPYGMTRTCFNCTRTIPAPGYDRTGRITTPWVYESFEASLGLKSSMLDLCSYMQRVLNDSLNDSFRSMLAPYTRIGDSKRAYVADGWHLFKNKKRPFVYLHSGKTSGHAASIHFVKETKTAVILITNSIGKMDGLATLVLRLVNNNWQRNG